MFIRWFDDLTAEDVEDNLFLITITTRRPAEAVCAQVLEPVPAAPNLVNFNDPDVRVVLSIEVDGPADGRSLDELVDEASGNQDNVTRTKIMLGGEAALMVSGLEKELGQPARQIYAIRDNTVYRLTFVPPNGEIPSQAGEDLEAVWNRVLDSFTFVPQ